MNPEIRFLKSADGTRIAYAVMGDGSGIPVVSVNSWSWTIDMMMTHSGERGRLEGLSLGRRVVTFDRRGTGASERIPQEVSFEKHIADLHAVVERLGAPQVHLIGFGDGASIAAAYAADYFERVARLILFAAITRGNGRSDSIVRLIRENWSWARRIWASETFPNGPTEMQRWYSRAVREAMSPELAVQAVEMIFAIDIVERLTNVRAPTLVVDIQNGSSQGRDAAVLIPEARLVAFPGDTTAIWHDDCTRTVKEFIEEDSTSAGRPSGTAVILFADIVDSTALTERLGDTAFRDKARDLDTTLRAIIRESGGTPVEGKLLGDGVLAVFTSARQAIEAALTCGRAGEEGGLPLHLGLHAGDVIEEDGNVFGGAVNIAARIAGESAAGEVLVSGTVRELARTSAGVTFEDAGERTLKGVGEPVRVWAAVAQRVENG